MDGQTDSRGSWNNYLDELKPRLLIVRKYTASAVKWLGCHHIISVNSATKERNLTTVPQSLLMLSLHKCLITKIYDK